jgi:hypothetical protein
MEKIENWSIKREERWIPFGVIGTVVSFSSSMKSIYIKLMNRRRGYKNKKREEK